MKYIKRIRLILCIENNKLKNHIINLLEDYYDRYYYDYRRNKMTKESICISINYWLIPREGTINKVIKALIE